MSVNDALSEVCRKGKNGVMEIHKSMRKVDSRLFWKLFDAQMGPILTCAGEVWGLEDVEQIEKVHPFAIKRFPNVPLYTPQTYFFLW